MTWARRRRSTNAACFRLRCAGSTTSRPHPDIPPGYARALAARLWAEATAFAPGPVHLNLRLREPLVTPGPFPGPLPGVAPKVTPVRAVASAQSIDDLVSRLAGRRAMIIGGPQSDPGLPAAAAALASAASLPILADPLSGLRRGHHPLDHVISNGAALASVGRLNAAPPEVVVRIGAVPTSKAIWSWLGEHPEVDQVIIDPAGWPDPMASSSMVVRADPALTLLELAKSVIHPTPTEWAMGWVAADRAAGEAVAGALAGGPPTDLGVARAVSEAVPTGTAIFAGSSMPIRDLDTTMRASARENRVFGNRGANGIDGLISSALGVAAGIDGEVVVLAGDLSTLHDLTGLAAAARLGLGVTVVVVNNDGGGIFHFLPQAQLPEETFERHFATPHGLDFVAAATGLGLAAHHCDDLDAIAGAMAGPGPKLIEVRTDRRENVEHHRRVVAAVAEAVSGL